MHRNSTSWSVWRTERSIWNRAYRPQFRQKRKRLRSPAGPRRLGTATHISASLSRRLSAFFRSVSDQDPKAAKFAVLPPGHAGFPQRVKQSEGSDTTPPPRSFRKYCAQSEKTATSPSCKQITQPAGPRRLGTATRISASLSRRLSAFFWSTLDQAPKAAKFAVLSPGHAGFPNRVNRSEGSDTTPTQNATCFAVCALVCNPLSRAECVSTFRCESERGPFVREIEKRFGTALWR